MEAEFTRLRDKDGNPVIPSEGATLEDWETQTFLATGLSMLPYMSAYLTRVILDSDNMFFGYATTCG